MRAYFENLIKYIHRDDWIKFYIFWELSLIKELGFEIQGSIKKKNSNDKISYIEINDKLFQIPEIITNNEKSITSNSDVRNALSFNKNVIYEHFIIPNKLKFPLSRNILQKYFF